METKTNTTDREYYQLERYYDAFDEYGYPKLLKMLGGKIAEFADGYHVEYKHKQKRRIVKERDHLHGDKEYKSSTITKLLSEIIDSHGISFHLKVVLFQDFREHPKSRIELFGYYDEGASVYLHLNPDEFRSIQEVLASHELPEDLFYPSSQEIVLRHEPPFKKNNALTRLLKTFLSYDTCYSPRKWQTIDQEKETKKYSYFYGSLLWIIVFLALIGIGSILYYLATIIKSLL